MVRHDLSLWPLVISVSSGRSSLEDTIAFTDEWNRWLARRERFVSLRVFTDAQALIHPEGSAQNAKKWLQEQGETLRRQVLGMVNVVPVSEFERMRKMNVEKLFSVPAATFADLPSSLQWLRLHVFEPHGIEVDEAAVTSALRAAVADLRAG